MAVFTMPSKTRSVSLVYGAELPAYDLLFVLYHTINIRVTHACLNTSLRSSFEQTLEQSGDTGTNDNNSHMEEEIPRTTDPDYQDCYE